MLQKAIFGLTQEERVPEAASRTDRHVHARGQVAAFFLEKDWPKDKLHKGLNAHLPRDIRILDIENVEASFHPTLDALEKEYHYHLSLGPVQCPIRRFYTWHIHQPLSIEAMKEASLLLIGKKDFSAFANERKENPICHLSSIDFECFDNTLIIRLKGDRFLYKMARNVTGLLVEVGKGKFEMKQIPSIFASKDRKKAAITAPAHGLFLHRVIYSCV